MSENAGSKIRRVIRWIVVFILTLILIVTSPLIALGALPFYTLRFVAVKYAKHYKPELGKILSTRSAIFATDDLYKKPKANILVIVTLKSNYDLQTVEKFRQDMIKGAIGAKTGNGEYVNPEFQQYISYFLGFPFYKWDRSFDIDNHFKTYDGPHTVLTQDVLNEACTEYLKTPFVPGRSPWEVIIFPMKCQLDSRDFDQPRMAGIFKCHHSFADGISIIKVGSSIIPEHKINFQTPTIPRISNFRKLVFIIRFIIFAPFEFVNSLIETWDVNECHISEDELCPSPLLAFERIPLDYVQEIKKSHGTGMTAVLMAAFIGGLRSFMIENGYKIPETIHSVTPFPMPGHSDKLRNFMTTCFVRLPIGLPTAEERLLAIEKTIQRLKSSTQPITYFYVLALIGALPSWLAKLFFKQIMPTAIISNFPGPQEQINYLGLPLEEIMFTAGLLPGRIGIGFNAISYNGGLKIQAAFNEALAVKRLPRTYLLDKVLQELQTLAEKNIV